ncbi:regulatory iron-sulfur-containing complex subunit RicT [Maridesulfovibrio hydrothermalis]|uniref:PSP1 domain protein n=1 Tax=Maridesulfovibrio hydrothermalis AM13 = DSM 14728 TaxID=1121451 RepID=L0RDB5_9BACT|nr:regulatory iron-sulfur-containing complex subunit RicT [Maridesulfovibrio hydrothermalis]CCO24744.1 PSP1 domain protein [Maridesulfovibrio hydrothermalis AM13 = DSM 14728]
MSQILGVKFNDFGQIYYFSSGPFVVREGHSVIVKTEQGMGLGKVFVVQQDLPEDITEDSIKTIYRLACEEDLAADVENKELSRAAHRFCKDCIDRQKLEMKLVDVEVFFDRSKMIFYFTAPGRIDFRELVKDLVKEYRTRIELRQIGVRHETQMLGAIGNCGQICCCRRFMRKFMPVTIRMAKEQNLFLNPTKISGICGRLLCCLSFEQENYEQFHKKCPKIGKRYNTVHGSVRVTRSNFFRNALTVQPEFGDEIEIPLDDWPDVLKQPGSDRGRDSRGEPARPRERSKGRSSDGQERSQRPRSERSDSDRARSERSRNDRPKEDRPRRGRSEGDRSGADRSKGESSGSGRPRSDRPKADRSKTERPRPDRKKRPFKPKERPQPRQEQETPVTATGGEAQDGAAGATKKDAKPSSKSRRPSRRRRRRKPAGTRKN